MTCFCDIVRHFHRSQMVKSRRRRIATSQGCCNDVIVSTGKQIQKTKLNYFQNHFILKLFYLQQSFFGKKASIILHATFQWDYFIKISFLQLTLGANLFFPWLLVFSYLTSAFALALLYIIHLIPHLLCCFSGMLPLLLLLCLSSSPAVPLLSSSEKVLSSIYHYYILASITSQPNDSSRSLQTLRPDLLLFPSSLNMSVL